MSRLSKTKSEAVAQQKALIDEYGQLDAELAEQRAKIRRLEELGRLIRSWHADADPAAPASSAGDAYEVVLSPAGMQTRVRSLAAVYKLLGRDRFLKAATVTLKSLEQVLDGATLASITTKERTGYRTLVVRRLD